MILVTKRSKSEGEMPYDAGLNLGTAQKKDPQQSQNLAHSLAMGQSHKPALDNIRESIYSQIMRITIQSLPSHKIASLFVQIIINMV